MTCTHDNERLQEVTSMWKSDGMGAGEGGCFFAGESVCVADTVLLSLVPVV